MKFRHKKIKREHSIINGALYWLEDLSKNSFVTDIIPGVIDATHSPERGVVYKYETPTGCKLLLKSGGSIQEAFVVTKNPEAVQQWAARIMDEISMMESSLDNITSKDEQENVANIKRKNKSNTKRVASPGTTKGDNQVLETKKPDLLSGIKQDYHMVEINKGLRDSYVESLASMGDLDNPIVDDTLTPAMRDALDRLQKGLKRKKENKK